MYQCETANVAMKDTCADTEAGPSKLTRLKVDGIPLRLGFYVVDKFYQVAMEMKIKNSSLVVNKEVISEMLGLRNEGDNILMNEVSGNKEMIQGEIDMVQDRKSDRVELTSFNSHKYAFGPVTYAEVLETTERVTSLKLKGKAVDIDDILSFSLGVTQDFEEYNNVDITVASTNVIQPIQEMPTKNGHRSNRAMMKSLEPSMAVEDNIFDAWTEYLNFNERLCNASSPLREFLPTFVVTEELKNEKLLADVRYNLFKDYMQKAIVKDQRWMDFKDVELTKNGHRSNRAMMKSLEPSMAVEDNIFDAWTEYLNFNERGGNGHNNFQTGNSSASMRKLGEIDKVQDRKSDRVELTGFNSHKYAFGPVTYAEVLETTERVTSSKLKGKAVDIDDILSFSLGVTQDFEEYNNGDITVASTNVIQPIQEMPHADFGRYLTTVGHTKASVIFTASLNFLRMKFQSKSKSANWGVYAMRHMETYIGNMKEKCECGLDVDGCKNTSQINKLRVKYAA
nr:hypothetical protein [Tanacetum cinerariifolium]